MDAAVNNSVIQWGMKANLGFTGLIAIRLFIAFCFLFAISFLSQDLVAQ